MIINRLFIYNIFNLTCNTQSKKKKKIKKTVSFLHAISLFYSADFQKFLHYKAHILIFRIIEIYVTVIILNIFYFTFIKTVINNSKYFSIIHYFEYKKKVSK